MKTYQYLTSGILEAYLVGSVIEEERDEVNQLLTTDPEILAQLNELEIDMEAYFLRNAVPPPPHVREAIEMQISETEIKKWDAPNHAGPAPESAKARSAEPNYLQVEIDDTHIRVHKNWRTAFIAVFILSKIFLILGLYYYFKTNSLEQEIIRLKAATEQASPRPPVKIR